MKIVLYISGKKIKTMPLSCRLHTDCSITRTVAAVVGFMKTENQSKMAGKDWQIFIHVKSKMKCN